MTMNTPIATPHAPVTGLLERFSLEATPAQLAGIGRVSGLLPPGTEVYIPFLPGGQLTDTAEACKRLAAQGLRPIPHLPARRLENRIHLAGWLARFRDAGAEALLLIAGDIAKARGRFQDTMQVLDTGLLEEYGFHRIGVAGHPEGHPHADEAGLARALAHKSHYARATGAEMWIVTQFVFTAEPLIAWLERIRRAGVSLPVHAGLPGPVKLRTLVAYAMKLGVAASAKMLANRPDAASLLIGRWSPDQLVADLADYKAQNPESLLESVHVFPFGGVERAADWFNDVRDGMAELPAPSTLDPEIRITS